jgi:putative endonuclease
MPLDRRREVAALGEAAAAQYLQNLGYAIVARNYRCRAGEIDVIAGDDDALVFVEVRTRSSRRFGTPEESITRNKAAKMAACALEYLGAHGSTCPWRIDLIAVEVQGNRVCQLRHVKHALA